jgi:hypothetical protein
MITLASHWYYEDFVREQNPRFPTCSLKRFFGMLWNAVPLLNEWHQMHEEAFDRFVAYKGFVPVCGAIILNEACDKVCRPLLGDKTGCPDLGAGPFGQRMEELGRLGLSKGENQPERGYNGLCHSRGLTMVSCVHWI